MEIARKIPEKLAGRAFRRFNHTAPPKDLLAEDQEDSLRNPIALIGFLFFGSYNALIWLLRNYNTPQERVSARSSAALSFIVLQGFTMLALYLLFSPFPNSWLIRSELLAAPLNTFVLGSFWLPGALWEVISFYLLTLPATLLGADTGLAAGTWVPTLNPCQCDRVDEFAPRHYTSATIVATITTYAALMGTAAIEALRQRRARTHAWSAIASNKRFFAERGLKDHNTISLRDRKNRQYVFKTLREDSAEFFQIDAPDNRMLLTFDEKSGAFKEWGTLRDLRPALAERLENKEPLPKGPPRRRAKFPRRPAPKKKGAFNRSYGWTSRP